MPTFEIVAGAVVDGVHCLARLDLPRAEALVEGIPRPIVMIDPTGAREATVVAVQGLAEIWASAELSTGETITAKLTPEEAFESQRLVDDHRYDEALAVLYAAKHRAGE